MKQFKVRLRFHRDLSIFLGSKAGDAVIERRLGEKTSIKDIIESCGVPHPEVDLILVDEQTVGFDHPLANDAKVEVFPVENRGTARTEKQLQTVCIARFVTDGHLGALTRNLRLLGFDVAYEQNADDRQLLEAMARENRALLTRDRRLLMHAIVQHGYYPRSQNADEQTVEVVRRFNLSDLIAPFTRCLRCNAPLEEAAKADIIDKLEPLTKIYYDQFCRCPDCKQIYWSGSHFPKLQKRIEEIRSRTRGQA
ncbi:MAG TPA: Mut7-C RNAse domain-containing protein [Candidatus Udaeobacter sp.]